MRAIPILPRCGIAEFVAETEALARIRHDDEDIAEAAQLEDTLPAGERAVLGEASILDVELSAPGGFAETDSDLLTVKSNLTLDGTRNLVNLGGFEARLYRLIDYTGGMTNNGLLVGTPDGITGEGLPAETATAQQVILMVAAPPPPPPESPPPPPPVFFFGDGASGSANNAVDGAAARGPPRQPTGPCPTARPMASSAPTHC